MHGRSPEDGRLKEKRDLRQDFELDVSFCSLLGYDIFFTTEYVGRLMVNGESVNVCNR